MTARVFLFETASPLLYKAPQTPKLSGQHRLALLHRMAQSEEAEELCSVGLVRVGSRGIAPMAAPPLPLRDREPLRRKRCS